MLRSHVESVVVEGGRAVGVRLRGRNAVGSSGSEVLRARRAVISNASVWDTQRLLPEGTVPAAGRAEALATPRTGSFMHLHLGIDADGLPPELDCHHLVVNDWDDIEVRGGDARGRRSQGSGVTRCRGGR